MEEKKEKRGKIPSGNRGDFFGNLNPMQRERAITHMNTIGTREEIRREQNSRKNADSGMMDVL